MASEPLTVQPIARTKTRLLMVFAILFSSSLVMIACTAVSVGYSVHRYWKNALLAEVTRSLTQKAQMFASRVNTDRQHQIADITSQEGQAAGARATVIDVNGKVIADSEIAPASLGNDSQHPEFAAALRGEIGTDTRKRNVFAIPVLYVAVPVSGGAVRLAYPLSDTAIASAQARKMLLLGSLIAVLAALAISGLASRTIASRL